MVSRPPPPCGLHVSLTLLLCVLRTDSAFSWTPPNSPLPSVENAADDNVDIRDEASCGCSAQLPRTEATGGCPLFAAAAAYSPQQLTAHSAVVKIAAGKMRLGTDAPHFAADAEGPAHDFTLKADLYMDAFEVSNARFQAFVSATGHKTEAEVYGWSFVHELAISEAALGDITQSVQGAEWWLPVPGATWFAPEGPDSNITSRSDYPAVHVSQRDAQAFCAWAGGRLPSEDEWEYAARGGKRVRLFAWGNVLLSHNGTAHRANLWQGEFPYNNTGEDGSLWSSPIDSYGPQNAYGLYNVAGNVWEWTSTRWCPRDIAARKTERRADEPARVAPDCRRKQAANMDEGEVDYVKRGGSFMCHKNSCYRYRVAARHKNTANSSAYNLGFRCAYQEPPPNSFPATSPPEQPSRVAS